MIIAIDGPAGSGKTTVARQLAQKMSIFYLDTGATYRALTYAALEKGIDLDNGSELAALADSLNFELKGDKVFLNRKDVSKQIRTPRIDKNISKIVAFVQVRKRMGSLQRNIAHNKDCVVEGRDTTTVVFSDADFKFYLDANPKIRAKRRIQQLSKDGQEVNPIEIEQDLIKRDRADINRKVGSLKITKDACYIDTTNLSLEEVVCKLFKLVNQERSFHESKKNNT